MVAYYNEIDPYAAQWLRNLIDAGHIAAGDVDERDILDILPSDLDGYTQCHFFAGIGAWSHALRKAGVPDDTEVWTGSCPCQPFSSAGRGAGFADERHLWPAWFHLIEQHSPDRIFGEQVASKAGLAWLDLVQTDMENAGYVHGAVDLCAAGVGAPHIRQRLWFVGERMADADSRQRNRIADGQGRQRYRQTPGRVQSNGVAATGQQFRGVAKRKGLEGYGGNGGGSHQPGRLETCSNGPVAEKSATGELAHTMSAGRPEGRSISRSGQTSGIGTASRVADTDGGNPCTERQQRGREQRQQPENGSARKRLPGPTNGFWRAADRLFCRDGKWRPVEPGSFPLAHGVAARVGRLRAYGNAITSEVAEQFIRAYVETTGVDM